MPKPGWEHDSAQKLRAPEIPKPAYSLKILGVLGRFWRNKRDFTPRKGLGLTNEGNISAHIAEETLRAAVSFQDFREWMDIFTNELPEVLLSSFDIFLLPYNPPAWEALTYFSGPQTTADALVQDFHYKQETITLLHGPIFHNDLKYDKMEIVRTQALWRPWTYCVVSYEAAVRGQCIVEQLRWLKGLTERGAPFWRDALLKDKKWKLDQRNGVFG